MPAPDQTPEPRIFLQPIADPSALGLLGFGGATFLAGAHFAHWFGGGAGASLHPLVPLLFTLGGIAQFAAGMWGFKARDGIAASMHTIWGAHWIAFGLLTFLSLTHLILPLGASATELGWWFFVLGALTLAGAIAATGENVGLLSVLTTLTGACVVMGIGQVSGSTGVREAAGYVFVASALCAWYTALALMLEDVYGRTVLPMGRFEPARKKRPFSPGLREPGVTRGQ